jgi:S1-C subfamily serine protease
MNKEYMKYFSMRNLIKLSICIITAIALVILINKPSWFFEDLPEENFVTLYLDRTVSETCEVCDGMELLFDVPLSRYQASGLGFFSYEDKTYILTADHFCTDSDIPFYINPEDITDELSIEDHYGSTYSASVIFTDSPNDLCLVESDMPKIETVYLADQMPEVGEDVFAIAAPRGYSEEGISLHFDGNFSGCNSQGECMFVLDAYFGSSGGIILNSDGEMISMIQRADMRLGYVTIGPNVEVMRQFLYRAASETGIPFKY